MGIKFTTTGCKERGKDYFRKGIYAQVAFSVFATGYLVYGICIIMGWGV